MSAAGHCDRCGEQDRHRRCRGDRAVIRDAAEAACVEGRRHARLERDTVRRSFSSFHRHVPGGEEGIFALDVVPAAQ